MTRIPKRWELTDRKVIRAIRRLAALPDLVRTTKRCLQDMASLRINRAGVCQTELLLIISAHENEGGQSA